MWMQPISNYFEGPQMTQLGTDNKKFENKNKKSVTICVYLWTIF